MKIKTCDLCKMLREVPITTVSIPTMDDGERVTIRKFDLCPDCLKSMALNVSGYLDNQVKKGDEYEF